MPDRALRTFFGISNRIGQRRVDIIAENNNSKNYFPKINAKVLESYQKSQKDSLERLHEDSLRVAEMDSLDLRKPNQGSRADQIVEAL